MTTDAQTWVVMAARAGGTPVLAWCRWTGGPRFDDLVLTATDGMSDAPEVDPGLIRLEEFLFQVSEGPAWDQVTVDTVPVTIDWDNTTVTALQHWGDPEEAIIMALTELGEEAVLNIIAAQGTPHDPEPDPLNGDDQ